MRILPIPLATAEVLYLRRERPWRRDVKAFDCQRSLIDSAPDTSPTALNDAAVRSRLEAMIAALCAEVH